MKLFKHEKNQKPEAMTLSAAPLVVWLDRVTELHIEPGDTAAQVAHEVRRHWVIEKTAALELATFWFAIGERVRNSRGGGWKQVELKVDKNRRYAIKERPVKS